MVLSESKVLQYFDKVKNNSAALDAFAEVMKMMNYTGLWNAKLAWYSQSVTPRFCLSDLERGHGIYGFRST